MSEAPDINVNKSDNYREIYVSGQIIGLNYDGLKITVFHDSQDFTNTLSTEQFKMSKIITNRQIECTLNISPQALKAWAILLAKELKRYEGSFGQILSPEEVSQRFREYNASAR